MVTIHRGANCDRLHKVGSVFRKTLITLLGLLVVTVARAATLPDIIDRVRSGVVAVGSAYPPRQPNRKGDPVTYRGTGFVVGNGRLVVTNAHVIPAELDTDHNETLAVFSGRGAAARAFPARVVQADDTHDLVLLEIQGEPLSALELGDSDRVREGQDVAFTGYPIGIVLGLYPVTHRAIIAAITPMARPVENARTLTATQLQHMRNPFEAFQLDAIAYPGNSGSPVYELATGKVVGVLNSVFVKESKESLLDKPSGISYAIPGRHIKNLLQQYQDTAKP